MPPPADASAVARREGGLAQTQPLCDERHCVIHAVRTHELVAVYPLAEARRGDGTTFNITAVIAHKFINLGVGIHDHFFTAARALHIHILLIAAGRVRTGEFVLHLCLFFI